MPSIGRRDFVASAFLMAAGLGSGRAFASGFPSRPIRLIVPYGPEAVPILSRA